MDKFKKLTWRGIVWTFVGCACLYFLFNRIFISANRHFYHLLVTLPLNKDIPASQLDVFNGDEQICVLRPYALSAILSEEEGLKRIFGKIDYSQWKDELIDRFCCDYDWGYYPVKDGKIIDTGDIGKVSLIQRIIEPDVSLTREDSIGGCHRMDNICFRKTSEGKDVRPWITISECKQ